MSGDTSSQDQQKDVQLKLGVFMLQVQRYEMLLKALLVDSDTQGTVESAPLNQQRRKDMLSAKPMGYLFDELNRFYLRERGSETPEVDLPLTDGKPTFRTTFALEMSPEDLAQTQARLDAFKNLRNRIVHHLLEDHNLSTDEGCERAGMLLERGLEAARTAYNEVLEWANTALRAQQELAAFVQGPHFGALLHGIMPDGSVDWPNCTAVHLLRQQEDQTPEGEMTRLDMALDAIRVTHPAQKPQDYSCSSWRQLLVKSGQFEVRRQEGTPERKGLTWYRSRS